MSLVALRSLITVRISVPYPFPPWGSHRMTIPQLTHSISGQCGACEDNREHTAYPGPLCNTRRQLLGVWRERVQMQDTVTSSPGAHSSSTHNRSRPSPPHPPSCLGHMCALFRTPMSVACRRAPSFYISDTMEEVNSVFTPVRSDCVHSTAHMRWGMRVFGAKGTPCCKRLELMILLLFLWVGTWPCVFSLLHQLESSTDTLELTWFLTVVCDL